MLTSGIVSKLTKACFNIITTSNTNIQSASLSKCLKYPSFIFLCPQKLSKKNPRKITKSLNYPNTIPGFFSEFAYVQDFFYVPRTIRGKKTNTLNYPNSIRYFGDLAKFSRILHENK